MADERVTPGSFERGTCGVAGLASLGVMTAIGWNELGYALTHPDEAELLLLLFLPLVGVLGAWGAFRRQRRAGFPALATVLGVCGVLSVAGFVLLAGLAAAFRH
ncbi:MAG: hypothetical protein U0228_00400 [Myxococcaceae bacterium]